MNCVFLILLAILLVISPVSAGLYSPNDGVVLLENDTISTNIYDSDVSWFVEFYSSWCGHCQSFAPSWKRLATLVQGWTKVIRIAAIDCAEARNLQTCAHFNIQGYPSLKFFRAHITNKSDLGEFYSGRRSPVEMQQGIIDFLQRKKQLPNQINFEPLQTQLSDQYYVKKYKSKHIALIFESSTSYLGKELSLDLLNTPKISVRRVVDDKNRMMRYNITKLPQVVMLVHNRQFYLKSRRLKGVLAEMRGYHLKQRKAPTPKAINMTNLHYVQVHKNDTVPVTQADMSTVYMQDLEGALSSIFYQELVIKKVFDKQRRKDLKNFVNLLVQCFPGRPPVMGFLRLFQTWLKKGDSKNSITPKTLQMFYATHKNDSSSHLPVETKWQLCQQTSYPCSLWLLFHTLTISCEYRKPNNISGVDVLTAVRGFVTNFFGCVECGKHFYAMSKNVENEVHSYDEGILWLWKAHNKVNKRLNSEPSIIYSKRPKVQYPPKSLCSECSVSNNKTHWKEKIVLEYLKVHYGVNNIRLVGKMNDAGSDNKDVSENVSKMDRRIIELSITMTNFDTSLCLIVYGAGIAIIIVLYIYVLRKRRRNNAKHFSLMA